MADKNEIWYLMYENADYVDFEISEVSEASGTMESKDEVNILEETGTADISSYGTPLGKKKVYKLKGVFSTANKRNRNGRFYPKEVLKEAVDEYIKNHLSKGSINTLSEYQHPPRSTVDIMEAVGKITKLYWDKKNPDYLMGEIVLLDNPKANQLKSLIEVGVKLGVSTRGLGRLDESKVVQKLKLITVDIVDMPSNYESTMEGIAESTITDDGILKNTGYILSESGKFTKICTKDKCTLVSENELDDIRAKIKEKFKKLL